MDSNSAWVDLDGDHVVDTRAVDVNGDGHVDGQAFSDEAGGVVVVDHNADVAYPVGAPALRR
jgi:hypothetical protein